MPTERDQSDMEPESEFSLQVREQAARKLHSQRRTVQGIWFGLGMMGLVGWSVAVPTLAGAALGMWIDNHYPGGHSWTLALLVAGLCIGCANAWHWIAKENAAISADQDQTNDSKKTGERRE